MTKREQYNLVFSKTKASNGRTRAQLIVENPDSVRMLNLLTFLNQNETAGFIWDLERCIASKSNVDEGYYSDYFGNTDVSYQYPNVNFGNIYHIPMTELKGILEEWLEYQRS